MSKMGQHFYELNKDNNEYEHGYNDYSPQQEAYDNINKTNVTNENSNEDINI